MNATQTKLVRAAGAALRNAQTIAERTRIADLAEAIEDHLVAEGMVRSEWLLALRHYERDVARP